MEPDKGFVDVQDTLEMLRDAVNEGRMNEALTTTDRTKATAQAALQPFSYDVHVRLGMELLALRRQEANMQLDTEQFGEKLKRRAFIREMLKRVAKEENWVQYPASDLERASRAAGRPSGARGTTGGAASDPSGGGSSEWGTAGGAEGGGPGALGPGEGDGSEPSAIYARWLERRRRGAARKTAFGTTLVRPTQRVKVKDSLILISSPAGEAASNEQSPERCGSAGSGASRLEERPTLSPTSSVAGLELAGPASNVRPPSPLDADGIPRDQNTRHRKSSARRVSYSQAVLLEESSPRGRMAPVGCEVSLPRGEEGGCRRLGSVEEMALQNAAELLYLGNDDANSDDDDEDDEGEENESEPVGQGTRMRSHSNAQLLAAAAAAARSSNTGQPGRLGRRSATGGAPQIDWRTALRTCNVTATRPPVGEASVLSCHSQGQIRGLLSGEESMLGATSPGAEGSWLAMSSTAAQDVAVQLEELDAAVAAVAAVGEEQLQAFVQAAAAARASASARASADELGEPTAEEGGLTQGKSYDRVAAAAVESTVTAAAERLQVTLACYRAAHDAGMAAISAQPETQEQLRLLREWEDGTVHRRLAAALETLAELRQRLDGAAAAAASDSPSALQILMSGCAAAAEDMKKMSAEVTAAEAEAAERQAERERRRAALRLIELECVRVAEEMAAREETERLAQLMAAEAEEQRRMAEAQSEAEAKQHALMAAILMGEEEWVLEKEARLAALRAAQRDEQRLATLRAAEEDKARAAERTGKKYDKSLLEELQELEGIAKLEAANRKERLEEAVRELQQFMKLRQQEQERQGRESSVGGGGAGTGSVTKPVGEEESEAVDTAIDAAAHVGRVTAATEDREVVAAVGGKVQVKAVVPPPPLELSSAAVGLQVAATGPIVAVSGEGDGPGGDGEVVVGPRTPPAAAVDAAAALGMGAAEGEGEGGVAVTSDPARSPQLEELVEVAAASSPPPQPHSPVPPPQPIPSQPSKPPTSPQPSTTPSATAQPPPSPHSAHSSPSSSRPTSAQSSQASTSQPPSPGRNRLTDSQPPSPRSSQPPSPPSWQALSSSPSSPPRYQPSPSPSGSSAASPMSVAPSPPQQPQHPLSPRQPQEPHSPQPAVREARTLSLTPWLQQQPDTAAAQPATPRSPAQAASQERSQPPYPQAASPTPSSQPSASQSPEPGTSPGATREEGDKELEERRSQQPRQLASSSSSLPPQPSSPPPNQHRHPQPPLAQPPGPSASASACSLLTARTRCSNTGLAATTLTLDLTTSTSSSSCGYGGGGGGASAPDSRRGSRTSLPAGPTYSAAPPSSAAATTSPTANTYHHAISSPIPVRPLLQGRPSPHQHAGLAAPYAAPPISFSAPQPLLSPLGQQPLGPAGRTPSPSAAAPASAVAAVTALATIPSLASEGSLNSMRKSFLHMSRPSNTADHLPPLTAYPTSPAASPAPASTSAATAAVPPQPPPYSRQGIRTAVSDSGGGAGSLRLPLGVTLEAVPPPMSPPLSACSPRRQLRSNAVSAVQYQSQRMRTLASAPSSQALVVSLSASSPEASCASLAAATSTSAAASQHLSGGVFGPGVMCRSETMTAPTHATGGCSTGGGHSGAVARQAWTLSRQVFTPPLPSPPQQPSEGYSHLLRRQQQQLNDASSSSSCSGGSGGGGSGRGPKSASSNGGEVASSSVESSGGSANSGSSGRNTSPQATARGAVPTYLPVSPRRQQSQHPHPHPPSHPHPHPHAHAHHQAPHQQTPATANSNRGTASPTAASNHNAVQLTNAEPSTSMSYTHWVAAHQDATPKVLEAARKVDEVLSKLPAELHYVLLNAAELLTNGGGSDAAQLKALVGAGGGIRSGCSTSGNNNGLADLPLHLQSLPPVVARYIVAQLQRIYNKGEAGKANPAAAATGGAGGASGGDGRSGSDAAVVASGNSPPSPSSLPLPSMPPPQQQLRAIKNPALVSEGSNSGSCFNAESSMALQLFNQMMPALTQGIAQVRRMVGGDVSVKSPVGLEIRSPLGVGAMQGSPLKSARRAAKEGEGGAEPPSSPTKSQPSPSLEDLLQSPQPSPSQSKLHPTGGFQLKFRQASSLPPGAQAGGVKRGRGAGGRGAVQGDDLRWQQEAAISARWMVRGVNVQPATKAAALAGHSLDGTHPALGPGGGLRAGVSPRMEPAIRGAFLPPLDSKPSMTRR